LFKNGGSLILTNILNTIIMKSKGNFSDEMVISNSQISDLYGGTQKIETEYTKRCYDFCTETVYDVTKIYDDGSYSTRVRGIKTWWNSL
jgi:hypothetical protein